MFGIVQGFSGNSLYAVATNLELLWKEPLSVAEFPRDCLHFIEQLGQGQFGEVHLAEAKRIGDILGDDFHLNRTLNRWVRRLFVGLVSVTGVVNTIYHSSYVYQEVLLVILIR
jgi:hypothetical protein